MVTIYVDADACPVKTEILQVAQRHDLDVYIVSNGGIRPIYNPKIHIIQVAAGADAADDWIAEHIGANDIAITADILLADRCLKRAAYVLNPSGKPFTDDNIGGAVAGRSISSHLRELGETTFNPGFSKHDRSRFLQALENTIQQAKRQLPGFDV